ncbi:binding-protein-dependent transport systems inner membrane component [Caldicellulosiruptor hydrothermalis 108]|uniref:Binding-protein-dependent transport systems inner membrane component n=1 Tax=Caldicellulosiruptor hydrothermalis (strain DSM 18901 / VKM B-2411 / 108) TaxID=632292 RepID=E4Q8A6_CALH1|nr:carbohydrate ABC transporter permease [Caldicellulosiruptor hydrothermalis]ADQ07953.1 binding-protein-dependent transport systems inner membrane component [Caldicellulosiruptor hydrothermalis 108]
MWKKENTYGIGIKIALYTICILWTIVTLVPYFIAIITSLKPVEDVTKFSIDFRKLSLDSYKYITTEFPFMRWLFNSFVVAVAVTAGNLLFNSMAAYALARLNFPFKKVIFYIIIGTMMIPGQVLLIPIYLILNKLGWIDSYKGLIIPWLVSAFYIFFMRQYFLTIPKDLEEAALIDGLSRFGIFFKIFLPLSLPALATQAIFIFVGNWNSFMWPSIIASSEELYTLPVGLNSFYGQYYQFWNQVLAGAILLSLPTIIVFVAFQKYFVRGIVTTGLKE